MLHHETRRGLESPANETLFWGVDMGRMDGPRRYMAAIPGIQRIAFSRNIFSRIAFGKPKTPEK